MRPTFTRPNSRPKKSTATYALFAALMCTTMDAYTDTIEGKWNLVKKSIMGSSAMTLHVHADNTGKISTESMGDADIKNLATDGSRVTFSTTLSVMGQDIDADFDGVIKGNSLTGKINTDYGSSEVSGNRETND
ncbi:hypothetical protein HCU74_03780 [Spongiibacter sp. KMU-166]|uniref:Lipocalin-like domain-containing protein n=1 Tax=Spongiibacter thalassae TaxID=2721624 RepID=A0ABX1GDG8_9GAMM|nr:hypothetical protein [Spongiibacter thalassae]NKI16537.1 hypothetical protein [Spongiibacter thalassae]